MSNTQYLPHVVIAILLVVGPGAIAWWVMQPAPTTASAASVDPAAASAEAPETPAGKQSAAQPAAPASPARPARATSQTSKAATTPATLLESQNAPHALTQLSVAQPMPPELPGPPEEPAPAPAPAAATEVRVVTYNASNREVTPPTVVSMPWLNPPPPDSEPYDAAIQVVVNEQGTVDSVRATIAPRTIGESIWVTNALSAIKAWRFQPALKDTQPVRYRLIVPLHTGK